jgi:hypothetical protein
MSLPKCEVAPPKQRHCAIPDCGAAIGIDHVVCAKHWAKLPMPVRGLANRYRRRFAGDPYFDRYVSELLIPAYQDVLAGVAYSLPGSAYEDDPQPPKDAA